jgi:hypothetical protein
MLFKIVTTIGLPDLNSSKDIEYIRDNFALDLEDDKAKEFFKTLMSSALSNKLVKWNDLFHKFKHYK